MSWPTTPTRFILTEVDERGAHGDEELELLSVSEHRGVVPRAFSPSQQAASEDLSHYKRCKPGQLVLNKLWAFRGGLGVSQYSGLVSPDYAVYEVDAGMDTRFVHYQARSTWFVSEMTRRLRGIGSPDASIGRAPRLNTSELGRINMYTPPLNTQRRVAGMLDAETARIDTLIEKNERVLDLLETRRRASITRMTDGPPGQSATRYVRTPLKYLVADRITNGVGLPAEHKNPAWPRYIRTTDIAGPMTLRDDVWYSQPPELLQSAGVLPGDLLLTNAGMSIGKSYLHTSDDPAVYAGYLTRVRPDTTKVHPRYLAFCCESQFYWDQINVGATRSTIDNFSSGKYQDLKIPLPPLPQQLSIVATIEEETEKMSALARWVGRQSELLRLRRRALITAAVTGQIEM